MPAGGEQQRAVPELFWFVDEEGAPMVLDTGGGGRNLFVFPFFTGQAAAQRYRDQSTMGGEWRLTSSTSADEIVGLCERHAGAYDAFAFDPQAMPEEGLRPATLDETKAIVEDHVGSHAWDLRRR
jgi:hypothetical protein